MRVILLMRDRLSSRSFGASVPHGQTEFVHTHFWHNVSGNGTSILGFAFAFSNSVTMFGLCSVWLSIGFRFATLRFRIRATIVSQLGRAARAALTNCVWPS